MRHIDLREKMALQSASRTCRGDLPAMSVFWSALVEAAELVL
jgi:hypothetical protein